MDNISLTGLLPEEILTYLPAGKEKFRGMQIFRWIHERGAESFDEMTNLSLSFREEIKDNFSIGVIEKADVVSSGDRSTDKYLWRLCDSNYIESVIIRDEDRITACISSQVGCKMKCRFCRTGEIGFKRNLTAGEIIDQLIKMKKNLAETGEDIKNIVFMGMGEPLDNIEAVIKALKIINLETGLGTGQRKITVSTCGIVPGILKLADAFSRVGLAISLNAPDDALRTRLMQINKKYPIKDILEAARRFTNLTKRRVTFEYILMAGVNDSPEQARKLLSIVKSVPSKVNLIVFNEYPGSEFKRPSDAKIDAFQRILIDNNVTAMLRKSKGTDISAACGQLAGKKGK